MSAYTEQHDAAIRAGYEAGLLVSEIAKELNLNKNKVIGRAYRLGLSHPHPRWKGKPSPHKKAPRNIAIATCVVNGISAQGMASLHGLSLPRTYEIVREYCECVEHRGAQGGRWVWRDGHAPRPSVSA